jgi:hypothetical protein
VTVSTASAVRGASQDVEFASASFQLPACDEPMPLEPLDTLFNEEFFN